MSYSHQKGLTWKSVIFGTLVFLALIVVITPLLLRGLHSSQRQRNRALNNAKGIAQGLVAFQNEYGVFPCEFTRKELEEKGHENLPAGDSACAYLAQLIVADYIDSESYFYVYGMSNSVKGDDIITSPDKLLTRGENSFSYVMAKNGESLSDVEPKTPLVITPLIRGGESPIFDSNVFNGYYVCGLADGSASRGKIDNEGRATKHLFATGSGSLFGDDIPVVKLPR